MLANPIYIRYNYIYIKYVSKWPVTNWVVSQFHPTRAHLFQRLFTHLSPGRRRVGVRLPLWRHSQCAETSGAHLVLRVGQPNMWAGAWRSGVADGMGSDLFVVLHNVIFILRHFVRST